MRRIFGSVVAETLFYMLITGLIIGVIFMPISQFMIGVSFKRVYSVGYEAMCIGAGLFVSLVSFIVVKLVVLNRLNDFSDNIKTITQNIMNYKRGEIDSIADCKDCYVRLNSKDIFGELAGKYNSLVSVIRSLFWQYERIDDFFSTLNRSLELDSLDERVGEFLCSITDALGIEIYHIDKDSNLYIEYSKAVKTQLSNKQVESLKDIISEGTIVELKDNEVDLIEFGTGRIRPVEVIYFPFIDNGASMGVVILYTKIYLSKNIKGLVERLLQEYTLALKSSLSYEKMQQMAAFDELTNIYNRRFGLKRLKEEYQRAKRTNGCLCALMFDIDHFKRVNDTYGHQAGDYILSSFAKILQKNFREEDVVMRYGGEEFLCALNNADMEDSYKRAEIIRKEVETSVFNWHNIDINITVSCGLSSFKAKERDKSIKEIIKEADDRLYVAKNSGRNRCIRSNLNCLT